MPAVALLDAFCLPDGTPSRSVWRLCPLVDLTPPWRTQHGPAVRWWREDDPIRKEADFRAKFPPVVASGMSAMSECERLLPTLEVVLGCVNDCLVSVSGLVKITGRRTVPG